jgi:hypothetical protein
MNEKLKCLVTYNGNGVVEYDRNKALGEKQSEYLDKMDEAMDKGINLQNQNVQNPDINQRLEFVAGQLYLAVKSNDDANISAMCTYIALRKPDAGEIKLDDQSGEIHMEIIVGKQDNRTSGIPVTLN